MTPKLAVVTGANKGIGFGIVREFCKRFNGEVYLTSRDEKRGSNAVAALKEEGFSPNYHQLDICDSKSVVAFRDYVKQKYRYIDVLVNNAAIAFKHDSPEPVAVQAEQTLFVNYFSVLSSCEILFPLLRNGARVVNMSSRDGHLSKIPSEHLRKRVQDPNLTIPELSALVNEYLEAAKQGTHAKIWGHSSYVVSKVALTALTKIQQRMLNERDIKVNAVHPGFVDTDMTSHKGSLSIEQGIQAPVYLALEAPDTIRGEFVWYDKKVVNWDGEKPAEDH